MNTIVQNLISAECAISSSLNWPEDFAPVAIKQGYIRFNILNIIIIFTSGALNNVF